MNTQELINALVKDMRASLVRPRTALVLAVVFGLIVAAAVFSTVLDMRPDIGPAAGTWGFLLKIAVTLMLAVSAMGVLLRLVRPNGSVGPWLWGFASAIGLLLVAVVIELIAMPSTAWAARLIGANPLSCLGLILMLSIAPLAGLLSAMRRGAPTRPGLAGGVAGLAAGAMAATIYATHCTDDSPLFMATWYVIALSLVTLSGCLAGQRWLRW